MKIQEGLNDDVMVPLLGYMCTVRALHQTEATAKGLERDCANHGAHLVESRICSDQCDLKTTFISLFHSKCLENHLIVSTLGHSGCQMDKSIEKSMLRRWKILKQQSLFEEAFLSISQDALYNIVCAEMEAIKRLRAEVDQHIAKRNELACTIMRHHFASSLIRCKEVGKDQMGPGERLMCDYESVHRLNLCKDTINVFGLATRWLRHVDRCVTTRPDHCYRCNKKRPPHKPRGPKMGVECTQCGTAWFCSIECQMRDESDNVFAHMHECAFQKRRKRKGSGTN